MATSTNTTGRNQRGSQKPKFSFKENLTALKALPPFFKLIWETHKGYTLINIALRLFKSVFPLVTLYIGKLIIDEVVLLYNEGGDPSDLWFWVAAEFIVMIVSAMLSRGINLTDALLGDLFANRSSVKLIEHAAELDLPQFEDAEFYDKLEMARRQTTSRVALMSDVFNQVQDLITIIFLSAGMIFFEPLLIVLLIIAVIPAFINELYFNQRTYSLVRSWTPERRELDYLRYIGASDQTAKEIKIFNLSTFIKNRFEKKADQYYEANKKIAVRRSALGFLFNLFGDIAYYGAYVIIIIRTINGSISIGDLTFLSGSFMRLRNLLQSIFSRFSGIVQRAMYLQDLFDFFNIKPVIASPEKSKKLPEKITKGFEFINVGFQYPNTNHWAVRHLNFHLKAGEKLALVGENGAGKTTLVKLLARLYDPSEGKILLDGVDLKEYNLKDLRAYIGVIFQDFVKFQMTAAENIAVGKIEDLKEKEQIVNSAELSLADRVIEELPEQYEQMLGRRFANGTELSGGQWQKVALGRAYMRDAQLIILDEPTAALDAKAEYEVFLRFSDLTKGKTAVLISHRFSTVRMADRILVLKGGEMQELGSHEELLDLGGYYKELFELQAKGYR